jgi:hypothetical protein
MKRNQQVIIQILDPKNILLRFQQKGIFDDQDEM